jgi:tetratricopeptide (TPR) repeat protein
MAYNSLGDYSRAIAQCEQWLAITREIGDRRHEGVALGALGDAYYTQGDYRHAIEYCEQDLAIARAIGDRPGEGRALWNMSLALEMLGQRAKAVELAGAALQVYEQIEAPDKALVRKQLQEWGKA